jgi:hypothetical protein
MIDQLKHPTEFLFAHWAVPSLKELRGPRWRELVTRVAALPSTHPDALAFALMMIRLNGCMNCDATRYRDKGGCSTCSRFSLTTLNKESESSLLTRYHAAQKDIAEMMKEHMIREKAA